MKGKLMKTVFSIILLIKSSFFTYSQDPGKYSYHSYPEFIVFNKNTINFITEDRNDGSQRITSGTFELEIDNKIPFLNIKYNNGEKEKLLMLQCNDICVLCDDNILRFFGTSGTINQEEGFIVPSIVRATSFLTEGAVTYKPENLQKLPFRGRPWVEGVPGQGINEKLFIENILARRLYISIGYVSYNNPHLYIQNSRPKEIRLSVNNKFTTNYILEDTPNYQEVILPEQIRYNDILEIQIVSVYEGTKYDDTCINNIIIKMY
jgi:hypothetical protein